MKPNPYQDIHQTTDENGVEVYEITYSDGRFEIVTAVAWLDEMDRLYGWCAEDRHGEQTENITRWEEANSLMTHTGRMQWR